jgi:tagatose 6-phosphate kinase
VHVLSTLGGLPARQIDAEFTALGIDRTWIETQAPTRVCTTVLEPATKTTTELVENAGPITTDEWQAFRTAYGRLVQAAQFVVLTGSLPPGAPVTAYRELLEMTSCPALLDVRGPELLEALAARPLVVKPNFEELGKTFPDLARSGTGIGFASAGRENGRIAAMQELRRRGAQWVVITEGARAVWVAGPDGVSRLQPPKLTPVNPIGSGDSFAAGMAWSLAGGSQMLDAVRIGIAAAGENALQLLPGRVERERVFARAAKIEVDRKTSS